MLPVYTKSKPEDVVIEPEGVRVRATLGPKPAVLLTLRLDSTNSSSNFLLLIERELL